MKDLIEALNIFNKYANIADKHCPTHCEHDILYIMNVGEDDPSDAEKARLNKLGFNWWEDDECWSSFRFGSA